MQGLTPMCPYCGEFSAKVDGTRVYPHRPDLAHKTFFVCDPCDARVGCHPGTSMPLGRLADAELRRAKSHAHAMFDQLWRDGVFHSRGSAYKWLASELGIDGGDCHIGMFDVETCKRVAQLSTQRLLEFVS